MTTATKTIELAAMTSDGSWELIGDFASIDEALRAAERHHESDGAYLLDDGSSVYGISEDPASGHYETQVGVWPGSGAVIPN